MAVLRPQRVSPRSIALWLREAADLCRREPLYFLVAGSGWAGAWYLPLPFAWLLLLGLPLPLAAGCVVAHAADTGRSPLELIRTTSPYLWRDLLVAGAAPWIFVATVTWTIAVLSAPVTVWAGGEFELPITLPFTGSEDWQAFRDLFVVSFLWLCSLGIVGWFAIPLMAITGLPVLEAWRETVRGLALNGFVVALVFFVAWVCVPLLAFLSPLLAAPFLALLSSVMYVSFRHIWLGRGKNEAVRTMASGELVLSPAPS